MKIYLAGSFRYVDEVRALANMIRFYGHDVYCFCDAETDAYKYSKYIRDVGTYMKLDAQTAIHHQVVKDIFDANFKALINVDAVIVALPCGKSAHLEAGWAVAKGKVVFIYGTHTLGDWDAMYCMTNGVFNDKEFNKMMDVVNALA